MPPLIAAENALTSWIGVTLTPCPKLVVASYTFPILSLLKIIPVDSPNKSTPVFFPNP